MPIGGGGYFRLAPYSFTRFGFQLVNSAERRPVMFYLPAAGRDAKVESPKQKIIGDF